MDMQFTTRTQEALTSRSSAISAAAMKQAVSLFFIM